MNKWLVCLIFLSACTVGQDYKKPEIYADSIIKNELKTNQNYPLPAKWYANLHDEQLTALIDRALNKSPDVEGAVARLNQARSQLKINKTAALPFINASAGWNYDKGSQSIKYATDSHYYNAGFDASWELDIWGKNRRQTESDEANVAAFEYSLKDVKISLAAEIAADYVALMQNHELLKTARENAALQRKIFSTIESKFNSGLIDAIDYNQAQYLLAQTEASIPTYESNIESYTNALAVLSGVLPSELNISANSPMFKRQYNADKKLIYGIPAGAVRLRPDVAAAERKLAAQNALIAKAVAELYPDVSISGFWGYASQGGHGLFSSKSQNYNYNPSALLPLLDWNKLSNNIELQKQIYAQNLADYKKALLTAVSEIKTAGIAWETAEKSLAKQRAANNSMNRAVSALQKRYDRGLIEFSELLTMRQNLIESQNNVISAQAETLRQMIAFYKAVGI